MYNNVTVVIERMTREHLQQKMKNASSTAKKLKRKNAFSSPESLGLSKKPKKDGKDSAESHAKGNDVPLTDLKIQAGDVNRKAKDVNDDKFSDVLKMIILPQSRNTGLKKFAELCRKGDENIKLSLINFLKASPECRDLFNLLENEDKPSNKEVKLIWDAFEGILLTTSSSEPSLEAIGIFIVSKMLNKHIKLLYTSLNPASPSDVIKSTLKLLTAFVAQGKTGAEEVLNSFDFTLKGLEALPRRRENKAEVDVRTCFIRFVLSFFVFGDNFVIKDVLALPVLTNGVVNGLQNDRFPIVHLILTTLNEKIVKNSGLLKKSKISLFNAHTLTQLVHLYVNLGKRDTEGASQLVKEIRDMILAMLYTLCTNYEHGILFVNKEGSLAARSNNPILLRFLRSIQKLAITEKDLRDLTTKTLAEAPDLIIPFITNLGLNLDPRDSGPWQNSIGFIIELWTKLPSFDGLLDEYSSKKSHQLMTSLIIPSVCTKNHLTIGLKHKSLSVRQKTVELIKVCLKRASSAYSLIKQHSRNQNSIAGALDQFSDGIITKIPDLKVFINCLEHRGHSDAKYVEKDKQANEGSEDQGISTEDIKSQTGEVALRDAILSIMCDLQQLRPGSFSQADYNICKLFQSNNMEEFVDSEILFSAISIALIEPRGNLKWFSKKTEVFTNALRTVFTAFVQTNSLKIKKACQMLIKRLIAESGSITEHFDEVEVWLDALSQSNEITQGNAVAVFFQQMCTTITHNMYSIIDEIIEIATDSANDTESANYEKLWPTDETSTADSNIGFTPLIVAALRNFTKQVSTIDDQRRAWISRYICFVLMDIMMAQENPRGVYRAISKYLDIMRQQDNALDRSWYCFWQSLKEFADYWCSNASFSWTDYDKLFSDENGQPFYVSVPSTLRKKLCPSLEVIENDSKVSTDIGQLLVGILQETPKQYFNDVIHRSLKVVFCLLQRYRDGSSDINYTGICLLRDILRVFVKRKDETDNEIPLSFEHELDGKRSLQEEVFCIVLEAPILGKLFLDGRKLKEAGFVTEIIGLTLQETRGDTVLQFVKPYFVKLSKKVLGLLKNFGKNSSKVSKKSPRKVTVEAKSLILESLNVFAKHMPVNVRHEMLSNLTESLLTCDMDEEILNESDVFSVIKLLISSLKDGTIQSKGSSKNSNKDETNETADIGIAKDTNLSSISSKSLPTFFRLMEKYNNTDLQDMVLSILETDPSNSVFAPVSIIDVLLKTNSKTSLEMLKILCRSSVAHAVAILCKFSEDFQVFNPSFMIEIAYHLLQTGCSEFRKKTEHILRDCCLEKLISVVTNPDEHPELREDSIKTATEILTAIIEDRDFACSTFIRAIESLSKASTVSPLCRYQIEFVKDFCIQEEAAKSDSNMIVDTLIHLMNIWNNILSKKEAFAPMEDTIQSCIDKVCSSLRKGTMAKLKDKTVERMIKIWASLLPSCLKSRIGNPKAITSVKNLLGFLYSIKRFRKDSKLTLENIYQYILSHSQFFPILLQEEQDNKDALLGLLLAVAEFQADIFENSHLKAFLTAYNATLSSTDQKILKLLFHYEDHGASIITVRPFVWGKKALELRMDAHDSSQNLYTQTQMKDIIDSLDRNMLIKTAFNFPLDIDVTERCTSEGNLLHVRDDIYDPKFLLPLFSRFLSLDYEVDCRKFIDTGCLGLVLAALSSQSLDTRKASCHIMARFMNQMQSCRFREKTQISVLLEAVKNSIVEEAEPIPSIISSFALRCSQILLRPEQHLYLLLNRFLLKIPYLDLRKVPLLMAMLNSSDLQFNVERSWIIQLLSGGLRTSTDYYIYKRNRVFEQIMSLYDSPLCDPAAEKSIASVIIAASQIHQASFDLVANNGLLSWLRAKTSIQQTDFVLQVLSNLIKTFEVGLEIVHDDGEKEEKKPVPHNFATECVFICIFLIEKHSNELKLENLLSLSEILFWCLSNEEGIVPAYSYISKEFLQNLLKLIDTFTEKKRQQNSKLISKLLENTSRFTLCWLQKMSDEISKQDSADMQKFVSWLCCYFVRQARNTNNECLTIGIVSDIISFLCQLCEDWSEMIKKDGTEELIDLLQEITKIHGMIPLPATEMVSEYGMQRPTSTVDCLSNLRSQTVIFSATVLRSLYLHGEDSKNSDKICQFFELLKSTKYQEALPKDFFDLSYSKDKPHFNEKHIIENFDKQAFAVLLLDLLKGQDSPDQYTSYVTNTKKCFELMT